MERASDKPKRFTIREVGAMAGVSYQTVSRFLNDNGPVSPDARRRIAAAIEKLGYRPNLHARALYSGKTSLIAAVIPTISDPFYAEILNGIEERMYDHGYSLLICNTRGSHEHVRFHRDRIIDMGVAGLFVSLTGHIMEDPSFVDEFLSRNTAVVGFGGLFVRNDIDCVVTSDQRSANVAARHLLSLGHRNIAYVCPKNSASGEERLRGLRQCEGLTIPDELIVRTDGYHPEAVREGITRLIASGRLFTALLCFSDIFALAATSTLRDHGIHVPDDVSVMGFDDTVSSLYDPKISTMGISREKIATIAADRLFQQINGDESHEPKTIEVEHQLIVRASTTKAPASRLAPSVKGV